jgi:hypothetical protein
MNKHVACSLVLLFFLSLFAAMVSPAVTPVLADNPSAHQASSNNDPMWCGTSTTPYVELKGDRWFEIGELEFHDDVWYEYQSVVDRLRSGEAKLNFDLFTGCVVEAEAYLIEWNLSSGGVVAQSGEFRWVQSDELQQFRVETNTSYMQAHAVDYTFAATIQVWSNSTAAYVQGEGFSEVIDMPYPHAMDSTVDTSVCGVDHNATAYYEVLHDRVYDVGDAFNGSVQIICPVPDTEYELSYSLCSDECQHYIGGTIPLNMTSLNGTDDAFPLISIVPDEMLNISSTWHFYASLWKMNETTGVFSDSVGVVTSMDIRDLLVVGTNFTLYEDDDPDTVPFFLDACVNTPSGVTVDERGCAFDYDAGDADLDGVLDKDDHCPETREGSNVNDQGCEVQDMTTSEGDDQWLCIGLSGSFAITASMAYFGLEWKRRAVRLGLEKSAKPRSADRTDEFDEPDTEANAPPYGWDVDAAGSLVPNWDEQAIVDRMVWLRNETKTPLSGLVEGLNREGVRDDHDRKWTSRTLEAALNNGMHQQRLAFSPPVEWGSEAWHRTNDDDWI